MIDFANGRRSPASITPIPRADWPLWTKPVAALASPADAGVGDTVQRLIGDPASLAFKTWYRLLFKTDCACQKRRAQWNAQYPYAPPPP